MTLEEFNLSVAQNITGVVGLLQGVNSGLMDNMFGLLILLTISIIFYIIFIKTTQNFNRAVLGTALINLIVAIFLRAFELIDDKILFSSLVILAIAIGMTKIRSE